MPTEHEVKQGDSTIKLADKHGFFSDTIWNDPANAELKRDRPDMNVLLPGDILVIPDKKPKEEAKPTEQRHRFRRKGMPAVFRLQVFDIEEPRANQEYRLTIAGTIYTGTTDETGTLEEYVPPSARKGQLVIGPDEFTATIQFGHLDPITELQGVQKRLTNIGYDCSPENGELDDRTRQMLTDFQKRFDLPETGQPDETTIQKLEEVHDAANAFPPQTNETSEGTNP